VGGRFTGTAEREIDGRRRMVMPGLVNVHCHPYNQAAFKGVREELGNPHLFGSALYDYATLFSPDGEGRKACAAYTYGELLCSGVTTAVDLSFPLDGWVDLFASSGLRGCVAPMYADATWRIRGGRSVEFVWDEKAGRRQFDGAVKVIGEAERHPSGRMFGLLAPAEIDSCTPDLLKDSVALARESKRPMQIHTSESVVQFNQIVQRHGKTPVQWARDLDLLGPETSLGHAIFLDHHSMIHWPSRDDVAILAESGTSVAHCPTVFSRYGQTLQSFADYRLAGVNIGIGTDTFPHNMLEEMRTAIILSRVSSRRAYDSRAADAFTAATVGGATLLGREDIGRMAVGAKADIVLVDLDHVAMRPVRDPLKSLVYTAAERAVRDVFVDGTLVVKDGKVLTIDMDETAARLEEAQKRMDEKVPGRDELGRSALAVAPLALPIA
jgi:5-methylthioadenosine/S-adenosylhomocysteine deaminase